jgi:hypothetical protein
MIRKGRAPTWEAISAPMGTVSAPQEPTVVASRSLSVCVLRCVSAPITQMGIKASSAVPWATCCTSPNPKTSAGTRKVPPPLPSIPLARPANVPRAHSVSSGHLRGDLVDAAPGQRGEQADRGRQQHQIEQAAEHGRPHPARQQGPDDHACGGPRNDGGCCRVVNVMQPRVRHRGHDGDRKHRRDRGSASGRAGHPDLPRRQHRHDDHPAGHPQQPAQHTRHRASDAKNRGTAVQPATPDPSHEAGSGLQ